MPVRDGQDVTERFPLARGTSAALHWRRLEAKGDGAGLEALEAALEAATSAAEVRALRFCRCGCHRLSMIGVLDRAWKREERARGLHRIDGRRGHP